MKQDLKYSAARKLRSTQTDAERLLWSRLRNRQLGFKFRRQQPIGPYVVDFVCFDVRLVIELDGGQHNVQESRDNHRTQFLSAEGYRVLRFWNDEMLRRADDATEEICRHLRATPHPSPLPQGEREKSRRAISKPSMSEPSPPGGEGRVRGS